MSKELLLPEEIIFELIKITVGLNEVAQEYQLKLGNTQQLTEISNVYHRIIERLMELSEYDKITDNNITLEDLVHDAGLSFIGEV